MVSDNTIAFKNKLYIFMLTLDQVLDDVFCLSGDGLHFAFDFLGL